MPGPPKISVIIPTFNRREVLARTLPAVLAQDLPPEDYEVVVVVDGSTDGTTDYLHSLHPPCGPRILTQPNLGPGAARHAGLQVARGELVVFLDDDLLCPPHLLREHVAAHAEHPGGVVLGPIPLAPESPPSPAADWMRHYLATLEAQAEAQSLSWPTDLALRPNSSVGRQPLLEAGGFDPRFTRAYEAAEVALRLRKRGVPFRPRPAAVAFQLYVKSARDLVRRDAPEQGRTQVRLCRLHPEYRPYSPLSRLAAGPLWKRKGRAIAVRLPVSPEPLLRIPSWLFARLRAFAWARRGGVRLLQARIGIALYRAALREAGSWEALKAEFGRRLPVLLYHRVGPTQPGDYAPLSISPENFEQQMGWLAGRGYAPIRPSDWLSWCREGKPLPAKPVLLSFDDAYAATAHYAFPVLERYRFSAGVFVVTGHLGGTNNWGRGAGCHRLMTAEQIRTWAARGIEFGAHSRTHPHLKGLRAAALKEEVAGSAADLAPLTGTLPLAFAYPYGESDAVVEEHVRRTFPLAFTTEEGVNTLGTPAHCLRRTMVWPEDTLLDLAWRLRVGESPFHRLRTLRPRDLWRLPVLAARALKRY